MTEPISPPEPGGDRPLLEREAEVAALREAVIDACAGRPRVVVVTGSAGAGRTRLLDVVDELATGRRARVLRADARGDPEIPPLELAYALLRPAAAGEWPDGSAGPRATPRRGGAGPGSADEATGAIHDLYWFTVGLTDSAPLVLVVDDLHRADPLSVRWLSHLAHRADGLPLLVVVSVRRASARDTAARALEDLTSAPGVTFLEPAPLSRNAVRAWLKAVPRVPSSAAAVDACVEATGGNPLLIARMLERLASPDPSADGSDDAVTRVRRAAAHRAEDTAAVLPPGTPPEVTELAYACAVLGDDAEPDVAGPLAGLDDAAVVRAAEDLTARGILEDGVTRPAVRAAVLDAIPAGRRREMHAGAGRILDSRGAPAQRVAAHFLRAGPPADEGVVELLHAVATQVQRQGDSGLAASYLAHALDGPMPDRKRVELLVDLGVAERIAAPDRAYAHLTEALSLMSEPRDRARVLLQTVPLLTGSDAAGLVRTLGASLRDLAAAAAAEPGGEGPGDRELRRQLQALLIYVSSEDREHVGDVWEWVDRTDPDGLGTGGGATALRGAHLYFSAAGLRIDAAEAAARAREVLTGGLDDHETLQPVRMGALGVLAWSETADDHVSAAIEQALAASGRRHWTAVQAFLRGVRSILHLRCGRVPEALDDARWSLAVLTGEVSGEARLMVLYSAAQALVEMDEAEQARELLWTGVPAGTSDRTWRWSWLLDARAAVLAATGQPRAALAEVQEAGRRLRDTGIVNPASLDWQGRAALLAHRLGETGPARAAAQENLAFARRWGTRGHVGSALRVLGVVQGGPDGLATLRDALTELNSSPRVLDRARCTVDLGTLVAANGDPPAARPLLRHGLDLAEGCGAQVLATHAWTELVAAGGRRPRRSGSTSLTPAELDVARLAAGGASNNDIAATLFVTRRAVEQHLTRSYRKLGITGRAELGAALPPLDGTADAR